MARTKHPKNTCPELAGEQNMTYENLPPRERVKLIKDEPSKDEILNMKLLNKLNAMNRVRQPYKGTWTEEEFQNSVDAYFDWCVEQNFEPSIPSLTVWLKCTKERMWTWRTKPESGFKHTIICEAIDYMEMLYFAKVNENPIPTFWKLKTNSFGYVEQTKVDITTTDTRKLDSEQVSELVTKLGLDKS